MKELHVLLQRFADAGLDFVVVGGFAGVLHGSAYVTDDLDICAMMSPETVIKLRTALADLHPVHRMTHQRLSFLEHPAAGESLANVYLETDAGMVDVLGSVMGIGDYQALVRHAIEVSLFGRKCRVISLEGLIRAKEAMGREKTCSSPRSCGPSRPSGSLGREAAEAGRNVSRISISAARPLLLLPHGGIIRSIIARALLLAVAACSLAGAQTASPMELVIGTYREGNNVTEPKPAQSGYFKTTLGAFQITQGLAGYKWFIEVIKHPEKRIYTRSVIENPRDRKKPFVYDGFIDPDTPSTTITHGPVHGLKIYEDYTLELIAYADEQRTQEIDRLTQKVRSYVDTTGPKLKLFKGMKTKRTNSLREHSAPPDRQP